MVSTCRATDGHNMGYVETTRIVIEQLGLVSYIFPLPVTFVDGEDNTVAR